MAKKWKTIIANSDACSLAINSCFSLSFCLPPLASNILIHLRNAVESKIERSVARPLVMPGTPKYFSKNELNSSYFFGETKNDLMSNKIRFELKKKKEDRNRMECVRVRVRCKPSSEIINLMRFRQNEPPNRFK